MADLNIKSKYDAEVETLAMNLRRNKLASSDSEARRMAESMLSTGKKVQDDFAEKEKRLYGDERKNPEVERAHRQIEQLASNLARGRGNVRIDIPELDVNRPLKELVGEDEALHDKDDDDEVASEIEADADESKEESPEEAKEEAAAANGSGSEDTEQEPEADDAVEKEIEDDDQDDEGGDVGPGDQPAEPLQVDADDEEDDSKKDAGKDSDDDAAAEEEKEAPVNPGEGEVSADGDEGDEGGDGDEGDPDFSVKELDSGEQLRKSEEERRAEREKMPESRVDLSNMFNVNK